MLQDQLKRQRVTEEEVQVAVRAGGGARVQDVDAVVLETDGQFTILREVPLGNPDHTTLSDVEGVPGGPETHTPLERRLRERRGWRGHARRPRRITRRRAAARPRRAARRA